MLGSQIRNKILGCEFEQIDTYAILLQPAAGEFVNGTRICNNTFDGIGQITDDTYAIIQLDASTNPTGSILQTCIIGNHARSGEANEPEYFVKQLGANNGQMILDDNHISNVTKRAYLLSAPTNLIGINWGDASSEFANSNVLVLESDGVTVSHTGDLLETTLKQLALRANTIGANGRVRIYMPLFKTGVAGAATVKVYLGATSASYALANNATTLDLYAEIYNKNAANNNRITISFISGEGILNFPIRSLGAIDTTADAIIKVTIQLANAGDQIDALGWWVEAFTT